MNPTQTYFNNGKSYLYVNGIARLSMSVVATGVNASNPIYVDTGSEGIVKFNTGTIDFTYQQPYTGIVKIYSKNRAKLVIQLNIGENAGGEAGVTHRYTYDAKAIQSFKGLERLRVNQYYYNQYINGANKITGDFGKYFNKTLVEFHLNMNLPKEDATAVLSFNDLDRNIPLEIFYVGYSGANTTVDSNFGTITGKLQNLPYKLRELYINDRRTVYFDSGGNDLAYINIPLQKLQLTSSNIKGNINNLPDTIDTLWLLGSYHTLSGNTSTVVKSNLKNIFIQDGTTNSTLIIDLSTLSESFPNLTHLNSSITNRKAVVGSINNMPSGMVNIVIQNSDVYGDIDYLPKNTYGNIAISTGQNTVTGDIKNLPKSADVNIWGQNTIFGDIALNPYTYNVFNIQGQNTITGNIFSKKIGNQLAIYGQNTVYGEPSGLDTYHTIVIQGQNTVGGDINKYKATNDIQIAGNNTIGGSITGYVFPQRTIRITGQNTITGDLGKSLGNISTLDIRGNNTINKYTKGKNWSNLGRLELHGNAALTSSDVDDLLIDIANTITTTGVGQIVLKGLCQPRTSRSDEAVLRLKTEFKKTVTTN